MKIPMIALAALSLAACSGGAPNGGPANGPAGQNASPDPAPITAPDQIALQVAAEDTGLSAADLTVTSIEAVQFSDSSLGCPNPDLAYLQVITPGHKVVVYTPEGDALDVRVSGKHGVVCKLQPQPMPKR